MSDTSLNTYDRDAEFGDYFALLKPRVMSLVVFTALVGLLVAPVTVHPFLVFTSILFIAVGAGASGALNMWWDADIDEVMRRTAKRPVPAGRVSGGEALGLGLGLSLLSVMMLALSANLMAGALLAFTIFFYAVVYSMWLKRTTPQNIVIGGAAGAFPPMIGWVVALPIAVRIALSLSAGVVEETFFRGFLQPRVGIALSTFLFVLAHLSYEQPFLLIGVFLLSLLFAGLVRWRQNIWAAMVAHSVFDGIQLLIVIPAALELMDSPATGPIAQTLAWAAAL